MIMKQIYSTVYIEISIKQQRMLQACTNNLALTLCTLKNHVKTCCAQDHLQPSWTGTPENA